MGDGAFLIQLAEHRDFQLGVVECIGTTVRPLRNLISSSNYNDGKQPDIPLALNAFTECQHHSCYCRKLCIHGFEHTDELGHDGPEQIDHGSYRHNTNRDRVRQRRFDFLRCGMLLLKINRKTLQRPL
ncbi:hypothetical protein D3C81_1655940 [compost metagenome]